MVASLLSLLIAQAAVAAAPPPEPTRSPEEDRLLVCQRDARRDPTSAITTASAWLKEARGAERSFPQECLGFAYVSLLRWQAAEDAFVAAREMRSATELAARAKLAAMAGNAALAENRFAAALQHLDLARGDATAAADTPLAGEIAADRARALVGLGELDQAAAALADARRDAPQRTETWLLSATLARRQNKLDEAQKYIETAAALASKDPAVGLEAGVIAALAGHDDAARQSWRSVVELAPKEPEAATARSYLAQLGETPHGAMIPLSVLDLVPIREGSGVTEALAEAGKLAAVAEQAGYKRFWVAEHHASPGIAGGAAAVVLAHIGHSTSTIRIGSGGVMLPNHNPFVIAEQFGTLDGLFPGRVDLGLGRAPGAAPILAQALRKDLHRAAEYFPQDVVELRALLTGDVDLPIAATPGLRAQVELWMLGSSLFGAQLAAQLGLPYAFASHFAPEHLDAALAAYRAQFRPSAALDKPHAMAAMTVICAETDEEAEFIASSQDQAFVRLRTGDPGALPPPLPDYRRSLPESAQAMLERLSAARAVGSPETVREKIARFVERTRADEIVVSGATYDPVARHRSLELTMKAVS